MVFSKFTLLLLLLILSGAAATMSSTTSGHTRVFVSSSTELQSVLCQHHCNSSTTIVLNSSIEEYRLTGMGQYCVLDRANCKSKSITIQSSSHDHPSLIHCVTIASNNSDNSSYSAKGRIGIAIVDAHVTIKRISFKNCGSLLNTLPQSILNIFNHSVMSSTRDPMMLYSNASAAALVLVNCSVDVRNVSFSSTIGFGILGINVYTMTNNDGFVHIYDTGNDSGGMTASATIVLHFLTHNKLNANNRTVLVKNVTVEYKYSFIDSFCFKTQQYFPPISGVTLIYAQTNYIATVHLYSLVFRGLTLPTIISIYQFNYISATLFKQCTFTHIELPFKYCRTTASGMAIDYVLDPRIKTNSSLTSSSLNPLVFSDCYFDNSGTKFINRKSIINILIKNSTSTSRVIKINLENIWFLGILGTRESYCLHVKSDLRAIKTVVTLNNVNATFITLARLHSLWSNGILVFENIRNVDIKGSNSYFAQNFGTPIKAIDSYITIYGHISFIGNQAINGGAIQLTGKSRLTFMTNSMTKFEGNIAQFRGGAIYADTIRSKVCPICFKGLDVYVKTVANFTYNSAILSGSSIYSNHLFDCRFCNSAVMKPDKIMKMLSKYFQFEDVKNSSVLTVSTKPIRLKVFETHYKTSDILYPGQTAEIEVAAWDALNRSVYSQVQLQMDCRKGIGLEKLHHCSDSNSWLAFNQRSQVLREKDKFSILKATVHNDYKQKTNEVTSLTIFGNVEMRTEVLLLVHHSCPAGFVMDARNGSCKCSSLVSKLHYIPALPPRYKSNLCSIEYNQFSSTVLDSWAGFVNDSDDGTSHFAVSNNCPTGNCNFRISDYYYVSTEEGLFRTSIVMVSHHSKPNNSQYVPVCNKYRIGPLCGACEKGYSVSLISPDCKNCKNRYLWLDILALLAYGPLLVSFMFIFTLTLSNGTLNGVLFYANLANIGILDLITLYKPYGHDVWLSPCVKIAVSFLEILNANPMFPTCLYDGMDELWKTSIRMFHQFYLWAIILLLICLSRYSTWLTTKLGRSSIKVFVTVFHISASRMFITLVNVFTVVDLFIENENFPRKVWFYDGTVRFLHDGHLVLSVFTLLIIFPLLMAYLLVLTFPKKINKTSFGGKYCRPMLEAILNPYKENMRYWFALRIVLLIVLYCVYTVYRGGDFLIIYTITVPILFIFIMAQIYFQPFKSRFINVLDTITMVNFLLVGMTTWYMITQGRIVPIVIECVISVFFNMSILLSFIGYRILKFLCKFKKISRLRDRLKATIIFLFFKWKQPANMISSNNQRLLTDANKLRVESHHYQSCQEFREPLLSSEPF